MKVLPRIAQLPLTPFGPGVALVHQVMDPSEENSAVEVLFQAGSTRSDDLRGLALVQVLASLMSDAFYEQLRTREQLGYVVSCRADRNEGVFGVVLVVQGAAKSAVEVLRSIDAFLGTVEELIQSKTELEVKQLAEALAEARLARPPQMLSAAERCWGELRSEEFRWARPLEEAVELRQVRKKQVLEAFQRLIAPGGSERRRLCSLVVAGDLPQLEGAQLITDPKAFARECAKWPLARRK